MSGIHARAAIPNARPAAVLLLALVLCGAAPPAEAFGDGVCARTAFQRFRACRHEVLHHYYSEQAICLNESAADASEDCRHEARRERLERMGACAERWSARGDLCDILGQDPYAPDFDSSAFEDDL